MRRMSPMDVMALFEKFGAYRKNDHFVYASGKHGHEYLDKKTVLADPDASKALAHEMLTRWLSRSHMVPAPDVVAGPAVSGADLATLVADDFNLMPNWSEDAPIRSVSIDKDGQGGFKLSPEAAALVRGRHVLLTEDILNTAASLVAAAKAVKTAGGIILGAIAIWIRGDVGQLEFPYDALVKRQLDAYDIRDCPFCKTGRPINTELGHGKAFLETRPS